jgi:hypothetical protein
MRNAYGAKIDRLVHCGSDLSALRLGRWPFADITALSDTIWRRFLASRAKRYFARKNCPLRQIEDRYQYAHVYNPQGIREHAHV